MDLTSIQQQTRRHFFEKGGVGLGSIALSQILAQDGYAGGGSSENPMAQRGAHYGGKAKNVIFGWLKKKR